MYTLDTNAIIYYLKGEKKAVSLLNKIFTQNRPIYISAITELELFSFTDMSLAEIQQIEEILKTLAVIPVDSRIARIAGNLRRNYRLKTPDSAIAATALFTNTTLITRNLRDFQKVPKLKIIKV